MTFWIIIYRLLQEFTTAGAKKAFNERIAALAAGGGQMQMQ